MSAYNKKITVILLILSIFLLMGSVCAVDNFTGDNLSDEQNSIDKLSDNLQLDSKLSEEGSSGESVYVGDVFTNPDFSEGKINTEGDVYGWNVSKTPGGQGKYNKSQAKEYGQIVNVDPDEELDIDGNALCIEYADGGMYYISQYIDFTSVKSIKFQYAAPLRMGDIAISVDGSVVYTQSGKAMNWKSVNVDVSNYNFSGVKLFEMSFDGNNFRGNLFLDNFAVIYNDKVSSNFRYQSTLNESNVDVKFENKATGNITKIIWDFGDGNNSSDINPIHSFKPGNYNVTLTVYHGENQANYTYLLSLNYPTINGQMYATVQDAIDHAEANAVINVPSDFSENLNIKQNLSLNFNGNKLTGTINVNDGATVTVTNISDVSSVSTDDQSKLTISDSNINSNLEFKAGNIDVNNVNFKESVLTITSANVTLVNVNVVNGGVVVNGGKSKITNSNLTGSDLAISQTAGELEITNNIIKDNAKGIEITGGNATITFNAIYNNTNAFNSTNANVISKNNWYGTKTVTGTDSYLTMNITTDAVKMYPGEKYTITVDLTQNNNEESTLSEGSLNTFTLEFTSPNGVTTPVTIQNGKGTFEFTAGAISEDVKLTLFGEEYELEDTSIVTKPKETNITITSSEKSVVVICLTTAEGNVSGASVKYSINGVDSTNVTDANGQIIINGLSGKITINATFEGNETLLPSNMVNSFDFTESIETNITITSSEKGVVVICLTTAEGNVSGASVKYSINGVDSTNVTDANGQIIINGLSGKITINATFEGNKTLLPSNMVNSFDFTEPTVDNKTNSTQPTVNPSKTPTSTKIVKVASKITAKKKTFKAKTKTKKYQITLKTKTGKAIKKVKVTLKVKGKTYKATTNSKGKATFKITKLTKKGKYTAVIKFAGNKNYKATSKKVKLTVKK